MYNIGRIGGLLNIGVANEPCRLGVSDIGKELGVFGWWCCIWEASQIPAKNASFVEMTAPGMIRLENAIL